MYTTQCVFEGDAIVATRPTMSESFLYEKKNNANLVGTVTAKRFVDVSLVSKSNCIIAHAKDHSRIVNQVSYN